MLPPSSRQRWRSCLAGFRQDCTTTFPTTRRSSFRIRSTRSTRPCGRPGYWCYSCSWSSYRTFAQVAMVLAVTALISAVNAATLKPTQCALWLRPPRPVEQRNFFSRGFSRGFERVYGGMENAYTGLIGRMVRVSGLTVLIGLLLAAAGIWGIARLPTAFIPNEDQGYLLIVAQLPDGAALGRTTAALDQATKIAQDTPGVDKVIAISGLSALDNFADQPNAGVSSVVPKPWDQRSKAAGTDILTIAEPLQNGLSTAPDGRLTIVPPPPIQGIGNAGGLSMPVELSV